MKILGYSERGIINSLIFSIGEDKDLMTKFLRRIPGFEDLEEPEDYEVLLEQSFSGFGDADLIIIITHKSKKKSVLFIEGKVKTIQKTSWKLQTQYDDFNKRDNNGNKIKYDGYSSNLFFQLYLKSLLFEKKRILKWKKDKVTNFKDVIANCGFRDRKIGGNKIVWKALKKIDACDEAYYVGLVPSSRDENEAFVKKYMDFRKKEGFVIHFIDWKSVQEFCTKEFKLKKVLEIFDYNEGQIFNPNL